MTDLTNADHVIIQLKSRYTWFANHIAKMDKMTKQAMRAEWGSLLNNYREGTIQASLQKSRDLFSERMQPYDCLKKFKALCDEQYDSIPGSIADDRNLVTTYQQQFDDLLLNTFKMGFRTLSKDDWEHYRLERSRLSTLIANQELKMQRI